MSEFEHDAGFQAAESLGDLDLNRFEGVYQQLYSEALEDGVITEEERARLARAAEELGLDPSRLSSLEDALRKAYEANHGTAVLDTASMFSSGAPSKAPPDFVPSVKPPERPAAEVVSDEVQTLRARVAFLEERVESLEAQLEEAREQVAYEVDFSDLDAPVPSVALDEPEALHRRLRHDPRDVGTLRSLFLAYGGDADRQLCVARALAYLGEANGVEKDVVAEHAHDGLMTPRAAVDGAGWRRLLFHPEDEVLTSDILAVIVSAVLLAHGAALKQRGLLPELRAERRLDPDESTVQSARCFGWAARTLGMSPMALFASPDDDLVARVVPTVPPVLLLGKRTLSGRTAPELAFIAGQQLAYFRPERFIRLLVPDIVDLQDIFLAALKIGNPSLPLNPGVRQRVDPIAAGIEPLLDGAAKDQLRAAYKRFVEHGGIANLQRWGQAADLTATRVGFALAGDLHVAQAMLELGGASHVEARMDDLIIFSTGERYAKLRAHLGITIET